jgi:hypothetical protein
MGLLRRRRRRGIGLLVAGIALCATGHASEYHGRVLFGEVPVPGATVTATQGEKKITVVSDANGGYDFPDLPDGVWTVQVEMLCFAPLQQQVIVTANLPAAKWELTLLPQDKILAIANKPKAESAETPAPAVVATAPTPASPSAKAAAKADAPLPEPPRPPDDASLHAGDGLLINGSATNAATSQFTLPPAFGNTRSAKSLYTAGLSLVLDTSSLDARPYSLNGAQTAKPAYNDITGGLSFGGPLNIPRLLPHGPNFFVNYQWTHNRTDSALSGLVPTLAQRAGDYAGTVLPLNAVAQALLQLYPLPNAASTTQYNYQTAAISNTHQDAVATRMDKRLGRKDSVYGAFALQSTRSDAASLFGFVDTTDLLGLNFSANWNHTLGHQIYNNAGYRFSRLRTAVTPQFAGRTNISGNAGIHAQTATTPGNLQDATDWGPPTLVFSSGIASLTDGESSRNRNETNAVSDTVTYLHRKHNYTGGADLRRQEFNVLSQQNPRGTYTFTGTYAQASVGPATGSDFADFLLGVPDTSVIAFGNADKYLRQSVYDLFVNDDWRLRPELTLSLGLRWDYGTPVTELKGRLVNLNTGANFATVSPVLGSAPGGLPTSLVRPDKRGFEPRLGLSWRPVPADSLVIRAGYGIYDDTSVYQAIATAMDQQSPLSTSVNESYNAATCAITLANGFIPCAGTTTYSFGVDPNFRVGYAQIWNLSAQRDLPGALVASVTYTGTKGTRGVQEDLPNSYAVGATNPCPSCQSGYVYRSSNGNSTRESGQVQLRRRLRSGFTATLQYTYSKSIDDDAALGGQGPVAAGTATQSQPSVQIAQNWLDLRAERSLSTFDQRHLLNVQLQYTSGMGKPGGMMMTGWRGTLLKEWTLLSSITAGSGLPETPVYLVATPGTGITGNLRPSLTGAPIYAGTAGHHLNVAAYTAPLTGQYGNAGRDSITGPGQFTLTGGVQRTFRLKDNLNLDLRVDATNLLNHVVFTSWNNDIPQTAQGQSASTDTSTFGLPASTNAMRSLQTTIRLRY